eukprot:2671649-Rhodomonas_salina.1
MDSAGSFRVSQQLASADLTCCPRHDMGLGAAGGRELGGGLLYRVKSEEVHFPCRRMHSGGEIWH